MFPSRFHLGCLFLPTAAHVRGSAASCCSARAQVPDARDDLQRVAAPAEVSVWEARQRADELRERNEAEKSGFDVFLFFFFFHICFLLLSLPFLFSFLVGKTLSCRWQSVFLVFLLVVGKNGQFVGFGPWKG